MHVAHVPSLLQTRGVCRSVDILVGDMLQQGRQRGHSPSRMRQGGLYGNVQQGNPRYLLVVAVLVVLGIVYWSTLGVEPAEEKHRLPQLIDEDNCVLSPPTKKKVRTLTLLLHLSILLLLSPPLNDAKSQRICR